MYLDTLAMRNPHVIGDHRNYLDTTLVKGSTRILSGDEGEGTELFDTRGMNAYDDIRTELE